MESIEQLLEELSEFKPVSAGLVQSAKTELNNRSVDHEKIKRNVIDLKRENETLKCEVESLELLRSLAASKDNPQPIKLIEGCLYNQVFVDALKRENEELKADKERYKSAAIKMRDSNKKINSELASQKMEVDQLNFELTAAKVELKELIPLRSMASHKDVMAKKLSEGWLYNKAYVENKNKLRNDTIDALNIELGAFKTAARMSRDEFDSQKEKDIETKELAKNLLIKSFSGSGVSSDVLVVNAIGVARRFVSAWDEFKNKRDNEK